MNTSPVKGRKRAICSCDSPLERSRRHRRLGPNAGVAKTPTNIELCKRWGGLYTGIRVPDVHLGASPTAAS